jgi:predicted phosphodiesterase
MNHALFLDLILVLKSFYIKSKLKRLLLKHVALLMVIICFSLINLDYVTIMFSPIALGITTTSSILDNKHLNYYFVTSFDTNRSINSQQGVIPQSEVCGDRQDNDLNGLVDESCSVKSSSVGIPADNFNKSKTLRIGVVGDIDSNQGLTTQLEIANHYNVQALIIPGDFEYTNGNEVLSNLQSHGFTKENTDIVVGNHDSAKEVMTWLDNNRTFGQVKFDFSADKLALFNIDANIKFDCTSPQFEILKSQIESSKAWFKFAVVHQPFVTVKSDHPPNGEFDCYDPIFRADRIDGILQAHNHNYQRFNIHGLMYGVFGTGTHDTGSSMYPLESDTWQGNDCLKCITGENGITIIDLNLNNMNSKHFVGWFLNLENQVLDRFESSIG